MDFFKRRISKDQARDSGMALVLVFLLLFIGAKRNIYLQLAIAVHLVNMVVPSVFRPFAVAWLGIADLIGAVVSRLLLAVVFFVVVTPVAILRRLAGKDALKLRAFKAGSGSVMLIRDHAFVGKDIETPY